MTEEDFEFIGPILPHKKCSKCPECLPLTGFAVGRGAFGRLAACRECVNAYQKQWRESSSERAKALKFRYSGLPEERKKLLRKGGATNRQARRRAKPIQTMLSRARKRAREYGREFSITESDVLIGKFCPVLGVPMFQTFERMPTHASPSLDRIDSSRGYVPGNVAVISYRANTLKRDATIEELEAIVAYMKANLPKAQQDQSQQAA